GSLASRLGDEPANRSGTARARTERDALADRDGVPGTRKLGAEAAAVRGGRIARAAHTARRDSRVRRAVLAWRIPAPGGSRALHGRDPPRVRADERARRRPAAARPPRRGTAARTQGGRPAGG